MALSDYLTDAEWDACFYASMGHHASSNFGQSMRKTIDKLIHGGYCFDGLDGGGSKLKQIPSGNPSKMLIWFGNPDGVDVLEILDNGRNFLKHNCPELVDETDDEWKSQMDAARKES
jgi:hypothetical protein